MPKGANIVDAKVRELLDKVEESWFEPLYDINEIGTSDTSKEFFDETNPAITVSNMPEANKLPAGHAAIIVGLGVMFDGDITQADARKLQKSVLTLKIPKSGRDKNYLVGLCGAGGGIWAAVSTADTTTPKTIEQYNNGLPAQTSILRLDPVEFLPELTPFSVTLTLSATLGAATDVAVILYAQRFAKTTK